LVQGLFPFVVASAQACATVAANCVDLIDEDDAGRVFFALDEQIPHPGGADPNKHLDKIGTADGKEGNLGLAGDGLGKQGFTGARRPGKQNTLGDAAAKAGEFLGILQEIDDFGKFFLGLFYPGDVFKGGFNLLFVFAFFTIDLFSGSCSKAESFIT